MASSQSLNHLLNFTLPPRETPRPPVQRRNNQRNTNQNVWNKERFVNAHYRFVMNPAGDYTPHCVDPDIFFQWNDILQIIIPRTSALVSVISGKEVWNVNEESTTCPICLSSPTAPRLTKCGHVFCLPCILHYLSISNNIKWARCPICFDSVNERQLKCVKWYDGPVEAGGDQTSANEGKSSTAQPNLATVPAPGSLMSMRLMQRPQITTLALPRSATWPSDLIPLHQPPLHFLPDIFNYARFMLATPEYIVADLSKDLDSLANERTLLNSVGDELGIAFIDAAVQRVRAQINEAAALKMPRSVFQTLSATNTQPSQRSQRQMQPVSPSPSRQVYYYYQAASALPVFLHPLDIKILLSHFHEYSLFPDSIDVRIEAVSEGTVNDDLRKRYKYLAHIPEGADVLFIEADLEGVVGQDILEKFGKPLLNRRTRRKEKERRDDRARDLAEKAEAERILAPLTRYSLSHAPPVYTFDPMEDSEESLESSSSPTPPSRLAGAWGTKSFASALHSSASPRLLAPRTVEETKDAQMAWDELEQIPPDGGRKKKSRLVLLGGSGGRRR